jgi:hypothetical protein
MTISPELEWIKETSKYLNKVKRRAQESSGSFAVPDNVIRKKGYVFDAAM